MILGIALSVTSLGAGVAFTAVSNFASEEKTQKAEAAVSGLRNYYLDCTSFTGWSSNANTYLRLYGSKTTYVKCETVGTNLFQITVDDVSGYSGFQFVRVDPSVANPSDSSGVYNWGASTTNFGTTHFVPNAWDGNNVKGTWSGKNGSDEVYTLASTSPSTTTKRIWVDPKDNFFDAGARAALRVFGDGITTTNYILGGSSQFVNMIHESKTQYFFYVDVPVNADCQLVRLHNAQNFIWTYSGNFSSLTGYNTTLIVYSWDTSASLSPSGIDSNSNYTVEYAERLLDGYSTCVNSSVNGYGAYANIKSNVLDKLGSSKLSTLRSATFVASEKTYTYGAKIDKMSQMPSGSNVISKANTNNTIVVLIVASVAMTSMIGVFFFLRKKKKHQ